MLKQQRLKLILFAAFLIIGFFLVMPISSHAISFSLNTCGTEDCQYSGGSVDATIDLNADGQIVLHIENNIIIGAVGEDPYVNELGFEYDGELNDLDMISFDGHGNVSAPSFYTSGSVTKFNVDFGFDYQTANNDPGRFQVGEYVDIVLGTTSNVNLDSFLLAAAHIGTVGADGEYSVTLTGSAAPVPEPATLLLVGAGILGIGVANRKRFKK